jgi:hypothetical protein
MRLLKNTLLLAIAVLLTACSSINPLQVSLDSRIDVRKLALDLDKSLSNPLLKNKETAILSIVNLKNFEETNSVAGYIQQQLYHYLFHLGFRLVDLRVTREITYTPLEGEFNLSRVKSSLKRPNLGEIKSIIIGTYTEIGNEIFFNLSMIELDSNTLRASSKIKMRSLKKSKKNFPAKNEIIERPIVTKPSSE